MRRVPNSRRPTWRPQLEQLESRTLLNVQCTIDPLQDVQPISRYVYGINQTLNGYANYTEQRLGGDLTTDWNWVTGNSNAGKDYYFQNESLSYFTGGTDGPGGAALPALQSDLAQGAATLLTVPINGYVAANQADDSVLGDSVTTVTSAISAAATVIPVANAAAIPSTPYYIVIDSEEMEVTAVDLASNQLTVVRGISGPTATPRANDAIYLSPDVRNAGANYLQTQFAQELPLKPGGPGTFTLTPDPNNPTVYADEFVNWVNTMFPNGATSATSPIWFQLDNEPDLWAATHAEIQPTPVTYAELLQDSMAYSEAIKSVEPNALVFGPTSYGWEGYTSLQAAPDANGRDWLPYYLQQMQQASVSAGERLLDVLDVHFYTSTPDDPADIVQAPRSLWDPSYTENSWIAQSIPGPIQLLPRLQADINQFDPGTKLSISEYNYGGGDEIAGAIAEADALGIFGEQGIYAASEWQLATNEDYIAAAFNMYRDFDGNDGTFGDTSVLASTSDVANSSIYASVDSANANVMTLVAINKSTQSSIATMHLDHVQPGATAAIYQLTSASTTPKYVGTVTIANPADFTYTMPGSSVTTLRIVSPSGAGTVPTVATAAQATPSSITGVSTDLSVLGADAGGAANLTYTWAVVGTPPAPVGFSVNGSNAAQNTVATFNAPGSYTLVATITNAEGYSATSTVGVTVEDALATITVTPGDPSLAVGAIQQYTAMGADQFGDVLTLPSVAWSASAGTIGSTGVFAAPAGAGNVTISASAGGVEGSTTASVASGGTITVDEPTDAALRAALATANAEAQNGDEVVVLFAASLAGDTITLTSPLEVTPAAGTVTIDGGGLLTLSGDGQVQVLQVDHAAQAVLDGLTVEDGNTVNGGGIANAGALTVTDCTFLGNTASASGGGIDNTGTLFVSNDTFTGNTAATGGGGLDNEPGAALTLAGATFAANTAPAGAGLNNDGMAAVINASFTANTTAGTSGTGGGIANGGTLTLMGSILEGNSASSAGGGIYSTGAMTVTACTIDNNRASYIAGGINNVGTMTVTNCTLAGNYSYLGGGIYNGNFYGLSGVLTLTNDTITANFADYGAGGGIYMADGSYSPAGVVSKLTMHNTIVAGNFASGNTEDPLSNPVLPFSPDIDIYSGTVSGASNLIGDGQGLTGIGNGDANHNRVGTPTAPLDPLLAAPLTNVTVSASVSAPVAAFNQASLPLADNGGATPTIALTADSLAIGAGGAITTLAAAVPSATLTTITVVNAATIAATNPPTGSGYAIAIGGETMLVTAIAGNKLTVVRGYHGTTATAHARGAGVFLGADQRGLIAPTAAPDLGAYQTVTHLVVLSNPTNQTADVGRHTTLTASVRGSKFTVQWQLSTNGGASWSNVAGAVTKSVSSNGLVTTTTSLKVAATLAKNGTLYRVQIKSGSTLLYTAAGRLTVDPALTLGALTTTQWTEGLAGFTGTLALKGGTAPVLILAAKSLPPGLDAVLTDDAIAFSGAPTKGGTFHGSVTVVDSAGARGTRTFTLKIKRAPAVA